MLDVSYNDNSIFTLNHTKNEEDEKEEFLFNWCLGFMGACLQSAWERDKTILVKVELTDKHSWQDTPQIGITIDDVTEEEK